jgi:uncharacterized membrane protein YphA (DoxX/SURF4 family)
MNSRDRLALCFLMMAQNPLAAIFGLIAGIFLLIPLSIPFLAVFLLIKLLEVLLAKKPAASRRLESPKIFFEKEGKW